MSDTHPDTSFNASPNIKSSAMGKHLKEEHRLQPTNLQDQFTVLKKCRTKFDCVIYAWDAVHQEHETKT